MPDVVEPTPAATVVLARDGDQGLETLLLRRSSAITFGGMWVFPGGRVDPADVDAAGGPSDEVEVARRAAVREAEEEAGLVVAEHDLVVFSHWVPPPEAPRRFSTWFFLAPTPHRREVSVDGGEIHEHEWMRPADAIARRDAGEIELAPPTWVTLWQLSSAPDVESALAAARASSPELFETRIGTVGERLVAMWHGDVGYDGGDANADGPRHRLSMDETGWHYVRDLT